MKKLFILAMMCCLCITVVSAQSKKELKAIQKEADRMAKEGWVVPAGKPLLFKQLLRGQEYAEKEEAGEVCLGVGKSTGQTYDAARFQALENAKLEIARNLGSEITGLVENQLGNTQLTDEEAASLTSIAGGAVNKIAQKLGRVITVIDIFKVLPNKNVQVELTVAYDAKQAEAIANQTISAELASKSNNLLNKVHSLLDYTE